LPHSIDMKWQRFAVIVAMGFAMSEVEAQQPAPGVRPPATALTNTVRPPTLAEIERQYLDGKISAREFQRFLQTYRAPRIAPQPSAITNDVHSRALAVLYTTKPNMAANPQGPALTEPLPDPEGVTNAIVSDAALQDVEGKIDELIRLKQAREQATNTTATATNVPAGALTKRQRLDATLKLYIESKLSDAEYKERREKILAEPGD
jgi:hypothetical protein